MPIVPLAENPPLPKRDAERLALARERSECPIQALDWYRLPKLFKLGRVLFGDAMMNPSSRSRRLVDKAILHACRVWREKYGACPPQRQEVCCRLLERAFFHTARAEEIPPWPLLTFKLRQLINSEWADQALKQTVTPSKLDLGSVFKTV